MAIITKNSGQVIRLEYRFLLEECSGATLTPLSEEVYRLEESLSVLNRRV